MRKSKVKRPKVKFPATVDELYGGGMTGLLLLGEYQVPELYAWFQKRHRAALKFIDEDGYYRRNGHEWRVPYGVRMAFKEKLVWGQMVHKYPYYVTWVSPKTGKRLKKYFMSLPLAIDFIASKAQYVDEDASVVVRLGFDIPQKLRGKFPRKLAGRTHYWCPGCMQPRIFRRTGGEFFAMRKEWSSDKLRYEHKDRKLAELACPVCKLTNRDQKFRRSNQPWDKRKFKKGVRRAKKRR